MPSTKKGFIIESHGDPSVGILPCSWKLLGPCDFEDEETAAEFEKTICAAFELLVGEPVYITAMEVIYDFENQLRQAADEALDYPFI